MLLRIDLILLGVLSSSIAVGYYSVASAIAGLVSVVAEITSLFLLQAGMRMVTGTSKIRLLEDVGTSLYAPLAIVTAVIAAAASIVLIRAAMPAFAPSILLIVVLFPGTAIQGFARIALSMLTTGTFAAAQIRLGLLNVALSGFYVPAINFGGALGAAITSVGLYTIQAIVTVFIAVRLLRRTDVDSSRLPAQPGRFAD